MRSHSLLSLSASSTMAGRQAGTELMLAEHILSNKLECDQSTRVGITPAWHSRQLSVAPRKNASSLLWDNESSP